jgi:pimeloyl-ACP methyl ester carboxylesterase
VVGLLRQLDINRADVVGFSVGGAVALHLAIRRPALVGRLVVSSVSFHPEGDRPVRGEAMAAVTVEAIAGTPMDHDDRAKSPDPERLQELLDKLGQLDVGGTGWADADLQGIAAPRLLTVGDGDAVWLEQMVRFLGLGGGEVNGDLVGVPASRLAVFPGPPTSSGWPGPSWYWERCCRSWMRPRPKGDHDAHSTLGLNSGASGRSVPWRCC